MSDQHQALGTAIYQTNVSIALVMIDYVIVGFALGQKIPFTICDGIMICENKHRVEHRAYYLLLLLSAFFLKSDQVKTIETARWDLVN